MSSAGIALYIHPLHVGRARAEQCEAVLLVGVDQFVPGQRRLGQNAEPAERIDFLVFRSDAMAGIACRPGPWKPSAPTT